MKRRVCGAVLRDGEILMVRHRHGEHDYWKLPGGGPEAGETMEEAIVREVREEVGLVVRPVRVLFEEELLFTEVAHTRETCFLLEALGDEEPALGTDPELAPDRQILADVAWFPLEDKREDVMVSRVIAALGGGKGADPSAAG
jgi:8-oxo-dGTP diphosphatase